MILILSEHEDNITDKVCSYLNNFKESFLRINTSDSENIINNVLLVDDRIEISFSFNGIQYYLNDFKSIWCRRGRFHTSIYQSIDNIFDTDIEKHFGRERNALIDYIYFLIDNSQQHKVLNNPLNYNVNKLKSLTVARECGLQIPPTIITNNEIEECIFPFKKLITKNIDNGLVGLKNGKYIKNTGTKKINNSEIKGSFFYSKFQKEIDKKYELRIFYLVGRFYSLAYINNQNDEIDSRNLDNNTIRYIPFDLSEKVKNKLTNFMMEMKLETGSIDMIVDYQDDFYFLEVNPIGQFDFLNTYGNFYIERDIAKYLAS